jgi:hypothetical protein
MLRLTFGCVCDTDAAVVGQRMLYTGLNSCIPCRTQHAPETESGDTGINRPRVQRRMLSAGLTSEFRAEPIRWVRQGLAWGTLMAITLLIAVALQALAARALGASEPPGPPTTCPSLSPATAALADGDDVRARFLARVASEQPLPEPNPESACASPSVQEPRKHADGPATCDTSSGRMVFVAGLNVCVPAEW